MLRYIFVALFRGNSVPLVCFAIKNEKTACKNFRVEVLLLMD